MATEVSVPPPPPSDFIFDSNCSSPYISAPSSPQRFPNLFFSVPTSPTRASSAFLHHINNAEIENQDLDFEFDFSGQLERSSLSADELFDHGKIRPLKPPSPPPPPQQQKHSESADESDSPRRSRISQGKKTIDFDFLEDSERFEERKEQKRGRSGRASSLSSFPSSSRRESRSMSPFRVSTASDLDDVVSDQDFSQTVNKHGVSSPTSNSKTPSFLSSISFTKKIYRKWKLKDFLLFRSASEGRATAKDPLRKYTVLSKKATAAMAAAEEGRNGSFRSTESSTGSVSRRRGPVSAHELHYTVNRAASEEMKKKTVLPYKQLGPLGCLGFNPTLNDITRGIGSLTR